MPVADVGFPARTDDGSIVDAVDGTQGGLDLAELDPETPELDLPIRTAEELQAAVLEEPNPITSPVQPIAGLLGERVRDEPFGSELGAVHVSGRQSVATDVQLAGDTGWQDLAVLAEHVHACVGDRAPNRHRCAHVVRMAEAVARGERGRLGRSVAVDDGAAGEGRERLPDMDDGEHVAACEQLADATEVVEATIHHLVEQPSREPQGGDPVTAHELSELLEGQRLRREEHERRAGQQRSPDLERCSIEREGRSLRDPFVRAELDVVDPEDETADGALRTRAPFGMPVEPDV